MVVRQPSSKYYEGFVSADFETLESCEMDDDDLHECDQEGSPEESTSHQKVETESDNKEGLDLPRC